MIEIIIIIFVLLTIISGHVVLYNPRFLSAERVDEIPISIIIPARNEARNLPILLESIQQQNADIETIVVNDRSTDGTLEAVEPYDVKIVNLEDNPWNGKSFVCFSGVQHANHATLLFLDADTTLSDSNAIGYMLEAYRRQNNRGILSIQPFHNTKKLYEKLSVVFNLMTVMGVNVFSAIKRLRVASTVFGPAMLTNKMDYDLTGGHAYAKDKVIEGEGLYEAYAAHKLPIELYLGKKVVNMQMYPNGIQSVIKGWAKHIASGSGNTHPVHMLMIILFLGGALVPTAMLALSFFFDTHLLSWVIAYVMYGINFYMLSNRVISTNTVYILLYPMYVLFFFYVYGISWYQTNISKTVIWKDRKIDIDRKN